MGLLAIRLLERRPSSWSLRRITKEVAADPSEYVLRDEPECAMSPLARSDRCHQPGNALTWFTCLLLVIVAAGADRAPQQAVALRSLVPASDPLSKQRLEFDASFANAAIGYVQTGNPVELRALAASRAAQFLLTHARQFDYEVPKQSTYALATHLFSPSADAASRIDAVARSMAFFLGPMLDDPHWVNDVLRYLPPEFRFDGRLFLTFGYDIGVALAPNASLNGAHPHFDGHPRELLYYAIHELHHVGFMTYRPPPRVADLKTCRDVLRLVDYSTQLEGMAVFVARDRRAAERALDDDADYVALQDSERMRKLEEQYFLDYEYLKSRGMDRVDDDAIAVVDRMSSGDRLWYRVGALMAQHIERALGREALVGLISRSDRTFVDVYRRLPKT